MKNGIKRERGGIILLPRKLRSNILCPLKGYLLSPYADGIDIISTIAVVDSAMITEFLILIGIGLLRTLISASKLGFLGNIVGGQMYISAELLKELKVIKMIGDIINDTIIRQKI